jgi:hypothetical protein
VFCWKKSCKTFCQKPFGTAAGKYVSLAAASTLYPLIHSIMRLGLSGVWQEIAEKQRISA